VPVRDVRSPLDELAEDTSAMFGAAARARSNRRPPAPGEIDVTPFAGVMPWLVSLWRKLRAAVEVHQATNEEQQVLHLIEYVTSAIGGPVLTASHRRARDVAQRTLQAARMRPSS
jgi:hypothetical protein